MHTKESCMKREEITIHL